MHNVQDGSSLISNDFREDTVAAACEMDDSDGKLLRASGNGSVFSAFMDAFNDSSKENQPHNNNQRASTPRATKALGNCNHETPPRQRIFGATTILVTPTDKAPVVQVARSEGRLLRERIPFQRSDSKLERLQHIRSAGVVNKRTRRRKVNIE